MTNHYTFGFVILHYIVAEDTEILLSQLAASPYFKNVYIVVVDNGSNNIDHIKQEYNFANITYLHTGKNLGFSRANNLGIEAARKQNCPLVIVSNNDVEGNFTESFFRTISDCYKQDNKVAIVSPSIVNLLGRYQNPYIKQRPAYDLAKLNLMYNTTAGKYIYFAKGFYNALRKLEFDKTHLLRDEAAQAIYAPHGSFFVLTPAYFTHYNSLDKGVFLFNEENILAERTRNKNLKVWYLPEVEVVHKEDAATNSLFKKNLFKKMLFIRKHNYLSFKYFLNNYIK